MQKTCGQLTISKHTEKVQHHPGSKTPTIHFSVFVEKLQWENVTSFAVRHPSAHMKAQLVEGCLWVMLSEDCHASFGRKSPCETAQTQQWWNHAHFYILGWHNIIWIALIHFLSYTCWTNSFASIFLSSKSNFQLISFLSLSHRKRKTKFASYKL